MAIASAFGCVFGRISIAIVTAMVAIVTHVRSDELLRRRPRPRRQRALAAIGRMNGAQLPRWRTRLHPDLVGNIDVPDEHGLIVNSREVEAAHCGEWARLVRSFW